MVRDERSAVMQKNKSKEANYHMTEAFKSNSFTQMRTALKLSGVDLNYEDPKQENMIPIMKLCYTEITPKNRRELARQMIQEPRLDINSQDNQGKTALHHACSMEHEDLVRVFSEDIDIDPNIQDNEGNTPLMAATQTGNTSVVIAIINCFKKFGLKVDLANNLGVTPLLEAAKMGYNDISRVLVTMGHADLTIRDMVDYGTAEEYAMESGRCHTPDILILSPIAQKKTELRRAREARGRKILSDYTNSSRSTPLSTRCHPISDPRKDYGFFVVSRNGMNAEQIQCTRRVTFQMGRQVMQRLTEQPDAEETEEQEMNEYYEQLRQHAGSLPNLADLDDTKRRMNNPLSKSLPGNEDVSFEGRARAWTTGTVKLPPVNQSPCSRSPPNQSKLSSSPPRSGSLSTSPKSETSRQRKVGVGSRHVVPTSPSSTPKSPPRSPRQGSPTAPQRKISLPSRLPSMPPSHTKSPPGSPTPTRHRKVSAPSMGGSQGKSQKSSRNVREVKSHVKHPPNAIPSYIYSEW
ncbi:B-cell lymphoma 3 protein-like [Ptychodera flava]|uniref:B-cell lymphoma 3 protein-like n=1 Tax=Ptychodera flava TaxID=63121 RepID=UPI00396A101F